MSDLLEIPGPDDRTIEVLVGGDPDGFPLLLHNGSPTGTAAYDFLDRTVAEQGLRLITFSRPGYGGSTPRPQPGRMADDVVEATAVLDHLGVGDFVTLGWSGGGPRALACAALLPDRCRAAVSLAGVAPVDSPGLDWFAGMAPENVAEYSAAAQGPEAYEAFAVAEVLPMLQATGPQLFEAMGELLSPVDRAALTPEYADWLSRCFGAAAAQGAVGAVHDAMAIVGPWGFDLVDIRVPVAIWQGREDAMVPFGHGEWLAAHVPGARGHLLDDHGHLSLVVRLDEILGDLKELGGVRAG